MGCFLIADSTIPADGETQVDIAVIRTEYTGGDSSAVTCGGHRCLVNGSEPHVESPWLDIHRDHCAAGGSAVTGRTVGRGNTETYKQACVTSFPFADPVDFNPTSTSDRGGDSGACPKWASQSSHGGERTQPFHGGERTATFHARERNGSIGQGSPLSTPNPPNSVAWGHGRLRPAVGMFGSTLA